MSNNRWVRAVGDLNEQPISIQYREQWQSIQQGNEHAICVQIAWTANRLDESTGFPTAEEQLTMLAFGEQLLTLEKNGNTFLAMILAHGATQQWVLYVKDLEAFKQQLLELSEPEEGYPLEMVANEDAAWSTFEQVYAVAANAPLAES